MTSFSQSLQINLRISLDGTVHTDHVHVFLFSAHTAWQLDERGNTGEVLDERYRVIVAF